MPRGTISWHTRPLFAVEERRQRREESVTIDLSSLSMDDLRSLESSDPFLFHSIPEVYRAKLYLKEVEGADLSSYYAPASSSRRGVDELLKLKLWTFPVGIQEALETHDRLHARLVHRVAQVPSLDRVPLLPHHGRSPPRLR